MYRLSSYGLRAIFDSDIVYTSCNFDLMPSRHFDFVLQTPRVIIKRYSSRYNVTLDTFDFFRVLLTIDVQGVHLYPKSDEFGYYRAIVLVIRPGIFLLTNGVSYALLIG